MRTAVGCIVWIVGFATVLLFEHDWLQRLPALPPALAGWPLAAALALGTTLAAGSLWGLASLLWKRPDGVPGPGVRKPWQDGQTVQVSGVLEAAGETLAAPFSRRRAVYLQYEADGRKTRDPWNDDWRGPRLTGVQHVPARLRVGTWYVELRGFPDPNGVDAETLDTTRVAAAAAAHVQRTRWLDTGWPTGGFKGALTLFSGAQPGIGPGAGRHLMNDEARTLLGGFSSNNPDTLPQRLSDSAWQFRERLWPPGQTFTASGTWRAQPPHLDIGYGPLAPTHSLRPGAAEALNRREAWHAAVFVLVLGAATVAAHAVLADQGGARVADWWQALAAD